MFTLKKLEVGPWPSHSYVVIDEGSKEAYIIDAGADPEKIAAAVEGYTVKKLLLTHGHGDHVGAVEQVKQALGVVSGMSAADQAHFKYEADFVIENGKEFPLGDGEIRAVVSPGHTPGLVLFELLDGSSPLRLVVGDAVFSGGPGKTWAAEDLQTSLKNLTKNVFSKPDDTEIHPGHGPSTTVGAERAGFETLAAKPFDPQLFGDVSW